MDLSRGICILCLNNTKVIIPPQAEDITFLIKDILADQIDCDKYDDLNSSVKVCPMCLHDIITVADLKQNLKEGFSERLDYCTLCHGEKHLICITEWTNFDRILENIVMEKRLSRCAACLDCLKCLDLLDRIKTNLLKKYPHLALSDFAKDKKKYEAERSKKTSPVTKKNHSRSKKRGDFADTTIDISSDEDSESLSGSPGTVVNDSNTALKHLKALKNSKFKIDGSIRDKKLLNQIAFVKLSLPNPSRNTHWKLDGISRTGERSRMSQDSDSSRDSPSPKQSFFKIRLKINPNKTKSHKVTLGKVTKPKSVKRQFMLDMKKELVVKIPKINLAKMKDFVYDEKTAREIGDIRTPTKASRKMLPEEPLSSNKKRKSVTFADVLHSEITDGVTHKDNIESTPLKSLLKKNFSPAHDRHKNGDGTSDESDTDTKKNKKHSNPDSDEELEASKGYVEDILKNNDNIFDSLKTFDEKKVTPVKAIKRKSVGSSSSDSEEGEVDRLQGNNMNTNTNSDLMRTKTKERKHRNINSSDTEDHEEDKKKPAREDDEQENRLESDSDKRNKKRKDTSVNISDSEDQEEDKLSDQEEAVKKDDEQENGLNSNVDKKRKSISINSSDSEDQEKDKLSDKEEPAKEDDEQENGLNSNKDKRNKRRKSISINNSDSEDQREEKEESAKEDNGQGNGLNLNEDKISKKRKSISNNSSDSEDHEEDKLSDKKEPAKEHDRQENEDKRSKRRKSIANDSGDSETEGNNDIVKDETSKDVEEMENNKEVISSSDSEIGKHRTKDKQSKLNENNDRHKDFDNNHKKRKQSISSTGSDLEDTQSSDKGSNDSLKNKDQDHQNEISSSVIRDIIDSDDEPEDSSIRTDRDSQETESTNDDTSSKTSEVSREEKEKSSKEENENTEDFSSDEYVTDSKTICDDNFTNKASDTVRGEDKTEENEGTDVTDKESKDNHSSDVDSDSENSSKSNKTFDSSNSNVKSKKRPKGAVETEEDILKKSGDDDDFDEPKTKREKMSEIDGPSDTELKKPKNQSSGVVEEPKTIGIEDNTIDDLLSKYSNPSPNLNVEDRGSRSEQCSKGSEEAEDQDTEEEILEKNHQSDYVDDDVNSLVKNNSERDITLNSDATNKNVTSKETDFDDVADGNEKLDSDSEHFLTVDQC